MCLDHFISLVSPHSDTSCFFCLISLHPHSHLTFIYNYIPPSPRLACVCVCVYAHAGSKLQTRQASKWKEILSPCLACHFLAHLIYFSGQGFLLDNIAATGTNCTETHAYSIQRKLTVTHCSELSVRTDVAPIIESERDDAVALPSEHMLPSEHR